MAISTAELFAQEKKTVKTADLMNKQTMKDPSKPEPPPFDFDKAISVLDIPLDAVDSVKRGFVSAMQPFTQPWENAGYSTASSLNRGTAVFATHLDHIADYVEKKTGMKKGGAFGEWAKKYNENADYWQKQAQENGATFLQEFFGEVAGGAVPGIAEFMLNVPYAVALGAAESDKKGRGEVAGAIIEGAKRGTLGAVFHTMAPFQQYLRAPMMGGVFALQTATEGGDLKEVAKAGATGAIYSLTSPGGRIGLNDIKRNLEMQTVKDMAAEPARELSPDVSTAMKVDKNTESATIPDVTTPKGTGKNVVNKPPMPESDNKNALSNATELESVFDGTPANAKGFADFLESSPFHSHGLGGFNIPTQRAMMSGMISALHNNEIRNSVVESIPVDVMNYLVTKQLTPKEFFDNKSMLHDSLSVDIDGSIPIGRNAASSLIREVTLAATKIPNFDFTFGNINSLSTLSTKNFRHGITSNNVVLGEGREVAASLPSHDKSIAQKENKIKEIPAKTTPQAEAGIIEKAKKYNSADEFVAGEIFYHGSPIKNVDFKKAINEYGEYKKELKGYVTQTEGVYLTKSKKIAKGYGHVGEYLVDVKNPFVGDIYDFYKPIADDALEKFNVEYDTKYKNWEEVFKKEGETEFESKISDLFTEATDEGGLEHRAILFGGLPQGYYGQLKYNFDRGLITYDFKNSGYDAQNDIFASKDKQFIVFDPDNIKPISKSQLTDIWNKAHNLPNPSRPPEVGGQSAQNADTSLNFAPEANFRRQPEQSEKTDEITRRSDLVRFLNEKLDIPIRTGRFRDQALGIFKLRPEVIRTEKANDIEVIAHEIGHAIQKFLYPEAVTQAGLASRPFSAFKNELDPMATQPKAGQDVTTEGFAEFIRLYVTNEPMAREKAPQFYEHFEKELQNKSPETREILLEARRQYDRWLKQPELQRVLSQVSVGAKDTREFSFDKVYTAAVDDLFPLKKVVDEMAKGRDLKPGEDPYILARLLRGYTGKADAFIDHRPFKFKTYEDVGKSLKDILAPIRDDLDAFRGYIVSRRTIDLDRRKIETGVLPADARKVINDYDAKFSKAFDDLKAYQDETLQYLKDSGVMDQKTYDQIKQMNEDYVPLYRIMDDKPGKAGVGAGMIARNPVKKITGSWRDIQDPLESIIKNTYLYINAAEKNAVGQALVRLAENTEGMGKYIEKIPTPMQEIKIKPDELKNLGIDDVPESVLSIFRPQSFMPKDNVISVWDEGKRTLYEVHPDVAKTFMALDKENLNLLMKVLSKPASWLRAGATLTPEFIARNPFRDQFSAFVYSKYGFVPGYDLAQGIFSLAKKDQMFWDWKKGGGDHSMLVSMDRDYLQDKLDQTLTKYPVLNRIKNPIELLRIASELGEEGTRIGEFKKGIKAEGQTKEGIQAAAFAARDITLDFSKVGTIGKSVNIITAFWNAQVQGMDKMAKEFKEHPARTTAKVAAAITLPSVLLAIATHDDPRIKEVPAWERDLFWIIPTENHLWRIPKPFELGVLFGSVPERITHYILDKDPHAFDELFTTVMNGATPGFVPTAAIPIMENWANKSVFFNRPIVPTGRTELLPEYQYSQYTTETAKQIGKIIGKLPWEIEQASPARVENLIRGWTGGLGMYALNIADQGLLKAGIVERDFETPSKTLSEIPFVRAFHVRYPSSNAESIQRFYDNYEKSNQIIKTAKVLMEKEYKPEDAIRLLEMNSVNLQGTFEAVNNIRQMISMIYINPEMTGDEKREMIDILYMQMIDIAKSGNQVFDQMKEIK